MESAEPPKKRGPGRPRLSEEEKKRRAKARKDARANLQLLKSKNGDAGRGAVSLQVRLCRRYHCVPFRSDRSLKRMRARTWRGMNG